MQKVVGLEGAKSERQEIPNESRRVEARAGGRETALSCKGLGRPLIGLDSMVHMGAHAARAQPQPGQARLLLSTMCFACVLFVPSPHAV